MHSKKKKREAGLEINTSNMRDIQLENKLSKLNVKGWKHTQKRIGDKAEKYIMWYGWWLESILKRGEGEGCRIHYMSYSFGARKRT